MQSESTPAIVAEAVAKHFDDDTVPAVDGVSFTVERGELIVFLGPSGCGKTTLLKMVNRLYEPTSGRIIVDGADVTSVPRTELRRRIGYVIQETGLFPHMTVEKNIAVVPELLGWDRERIGDRVTELLKLLGLPDDYRTRRPRQLSGGERQRVGIARAMAADPDIMLMDEPFGALDAITRQRLQEEFLGIQATLRKTILFVTHDVDEAVRLADRILIMRSGRLVQLDTPLAILLAPEDEFVEQLMRTDDAVHRLGMLTVADLPNWPLREGDAAAMPPIGTDQPVAYLDTDLRSVLDRLLQSESRELAVVDGEGRPVGVVGFENLRSIMPTVGDED